jgi:hypothetical protein
MAILPVPDSVLPVTVAAVIGRRVQHYSSITPDVDHVLAEVGKGVCDVHPRRPARGRDGVAGDDSALAY